MRERGVEALRDGGLQPRAGDGPRRRRRLRRRGVHQPRSRPPRLPRRRRGLLPRQGAAVHARRAPGWRWSTSTTRTAGGSPSEATIPVRTFSPPGADADWQAPDVRADGDRLGRSPCARRASEHRTSSARSPATSTSPTRCARSPVLVEAGLRRSPRSPTALAPRCPACPDGSSRSTSGQDFLALVDYAHKPDAVEAVLTSLRGRTAGRLLVVIGAGGDRDRGKRPLMGEIAGPAGRRARRDRRQPAHRGPRGDPGRGAGRRAGGGAGRGARGRRPRAPRSALAVSLAGPGDCVVVAGKGHETGQEVAGTVHPFDDRVELRAAILEQLGEVASRDPDDPRGDRRRRRRRRSHDDPDGVDGHRAGLPRHPRRRSPAGSSPRSSASTSTGTSTPPPRCADGAAAVLGSAPGRGARRSSSPTRRRRSAGWRTTSCGRLPDLAGARRDRLPGQDLDQGPARRGARGRTRPPWRPAGSFNNELGPAADRAARRRGDALPAARDGRPRHRPPARRCARSRARTSRWCSTSARPTSASSAPRTTSRPPRASWSRRSTDDGHRGAQRRRPAGGRHGRAYDGPGAHLRQRPPAPTSASGTSPLDEDGRPRVHAGPRRRHRRGARCSLVGRAPGAATPPPRRPPRSPSGIGLADACAEPGPGRDAVAVADGGAPTAPTGSPWSTTPTTPTPTRWRPRSRRWSRSAGGAAADATVAVLGEMRELGESSDAGARERSADWPCASGCTSVVAVGEAARGGRTPARSRQERRRRRRCSWRTTTRPCAGSTTHAAAR